MPSPQDPKWEVVDELPGEKKPKTQSKPVARLLKNKVLWIGVGVGVACVFAFPILRVILQNLLRSWWLWVGLAAYWYWRRIQRAGKR